MTAPTATSTVDRHRSALETTPIATSTVHRHRLALKTTPATPRAAS
jgi:hypothetical protein